MDSNNQHKSHSIGLPLNVMVLLMVNSYFIFVADAADIVRGEFFVMWRNIRYREILNVEKFELWRNLRCGEIYFEMWRYIRWREILDVEKFQTWRFFRYKEKHNSHCFAVRSVLLPCMLFCRKICSFEIYADFLQNLFCRDLRISMWRKIKPKILSVEKKWQI